MSSHDIVRHHASGGADARVSARSASRVFPGPRYARAAVASIRLMTLSLLALVPNPASIMAQQCAALPTFQATFQAKFQAMFQAMFQAPPASVLCLNGRRIVSRPIE